MMPDATDQIPGPVDLVYVAAEIMDRRDRQDAEHGGPAHDDTHAPGDWIGFIRRQTTLALGELIKAVDRGGGTPDRMDFYEDKLLDVAALAVAAIQSSRRKRNTAKGTDPERDNPENGDLQEDRRL